ncbi:hypothetical protein ONZ45_g13821 [Pleurotus djamor]|nr:hypothetical protein ONZ45_g13821 [Pleurotus djamor]
MPDDPKPKKPIVIITIGMAGAGKSTFVQRINSFLHSQDPPKPPYILNLDPAVTQVPFEANIDIRDTVNYQEVMKQYNLGPNGGIMTALNLFTTKFDQVLELVEKRADEVDYVILDTPGQIEIFTWSASGAIITDAVASSFPTVVAYIVDTPRTTAPATFMSNMLYACSILYKTKLPFILVFNKTDVQPHDFALDWMRDFEEFQAALATHDGARDSEGEPTYMNSLMNSMSLVLDEFYKQLKSVGVSSMTGLGVKEFFEAVDASRDEYEKDYLPDLERARAAREKSLREAKEDSMNRLMKDLSVDRAKNPEAAKADRWDPAEEEDDDDDDLDVNIIDRSEEPWPVWQRLVKNETEFYQFLGGIPHLEYLSAPFIPDRNDPVNCPPEALTQLNFLHAHANQVITILPGRTVQHLEIPHGFSHTSLGGLSFPSITTLATTSAGLPCLHSFPNLECLKVNHTSAGNPSLKGALEIFRPLTCPSLQYLSVRFKFIVKNLRTSKSIRKEAYRPQKSIVGHGAFHGFPALRVIDITLEWSPDEPVEILRYTLSENGIFDSDPMEMAQDDSENRISYWETWWTSSRFKSAALMCSSSTDR